MSKGKPNAGTGAGTGTGGAVKKDGTARKSTKGIPRVTDKVVAMDEAKRKEWLDKVPADHRAEVETRLNEALNGERKPKSVNFETIYKGRSLEELTKAQTYLTVELATAKEADEKRLESLIAEKQKELDAIRNAKAEKATAAVTA